MQDMLLALAKYSLRFYGELQYEQDAFFFKNKYPGQWMQLPSRCRVTHSLQTLGLKSRAYSSLKFFC